MADSLNRSNGLPPGESGDSEVKDGQREKPLKRFGLTPVGGHLTEEVLMRNLGVCHRLRELIPSGSFEPTQVRN